MALPLRMLLDASIPCQVGEHRLVHPSSFSCLHHCGLVDHHARNYHWSSLLIRVVRRRVEQGPLVSLMMLRVGVVGLAAFVASQWKEVVGHLRVPAFLLEVVVLLLLPLGGI